jgi:hypothetical protein
MGYDVRITRKTDSSDKEGEEISLQEWLDVVEADKEFRREGFAETPTPGGSVRIQGDGLAVWTARSGKHQVWFDYWRGRVVVKNPDEETIGKMCRVAEALGAYVQGEEGELYNVTTDSAGSKQGKWWKRR